MRQLCQQLPVLLGLLLLGIAVWEQNPGLQPCGSNSVGAWLLPGAHAASFVDPVMLAAPDNSSLPNHLSPLYDPSSNFSTVTYDWTSGRWTAPDKQKQWWEGRRPADFTQVDLYLNHSWEGAQNVSQPYSVPFYPAPDMTSFETFNLVDYNHSDYDLPKPRYFQRPSLRGAVPFQGLPPGAPLPWYGNNVAFNSSDYARVFYLADNYFTGNEPLVNYGPTQCRTEFVDICSTDDDIGPMHVYAPVTLDYGTTPSWLNISRPPDSYLTNSSWAGWHWDWEGGYDASSTGSSLPHVCDVALRDLVIPASTEGITFTWNSTACARSGRAKPFLTSIDDMGPTVYHDAQHTLEPSHAVISYQAVDLYLANSTDYRDIPFERLWADHAIYYGNDHLGTSVFQAYGGYPGYWYSGYMSAEWNNSGSGLVFSNGAECITSMNDDDTCTLTISPAPPDVWAQNSTCARSIPHGVPLIVCRDASGNRNIIPFAYNRARNSSSVAAVPKLRYTATGKYDTSGDATTYVPQGRIPNVPCNRFAWSKRFGGRCAAPVVQYLAYDEAYHTGHAQSTYAGIPEYGGCLDGGLMRFIKPSMPNNDTTLWNNSDTRKWFTPPMWPYTAWRAATDDDTSTSDVLYSLYNTDTYTWTANSLNTNQSELDRLFIYQKVFQVPDAVPVSGCTVIQRVSGRCLSAPPSLSNSQTFWDGNAVQMATCNAADPLQCFQVEGDFSISARIMYKGLCIGVDPTSTMPNAWNVPTNVVNLRPCDEGWTTWQRYSNGNVKLPGCGASTTGRCLYVWIDRGPSLSPTLALGTPQPPTSTSTIQNCVKFSIYTANSKPAWPTYNLLRQFWLDSFASSAVDIRAHRIRFIPYGARQGLNTRGGGINQGCSGNLGQWVSQSKQTVNNCQYNRGVTLGGVTYDRDSCMTARDNFLANDTLMGQLAPVCWSNTAWMYLYANKCHRFSSDLRLSQRDVSRDNVIAQCAGQTNCSGANPADKCASRVGGQYVAVDDVWSFMKNDTHDPCGWPFVECVASCSLPSDPTVKSWTIKSDGFVYSNSTQKVGCVGDCTHAMKDPKVANSIAAIDWRNMALYSNNLNFSAFLAKDVNGITFGSKVWYLNLNYNMLGGDLSQLANLPNIFPNLVHLGLAHCSAGKYAPQYAWQQTQPDFCDATDAQGHVTDTRCYCPDDSWNDMTVIPNVGAAIADFKANHSLTWTVARGVTRMFYGTIPSSWGTNAAWSTTLMSVNLAGHTKLVGDLPSAWYNQTAYPQLFYLRLKGTQISPVTSKLIWTNTSCSHIQWDIKTPGSGNSTADWVHNCTITGHCTDCDWWPARSAAPWYYDGRPSQPTCATYLPTPDSSGSNSFPCWQDGGFVYNTSSDTNTSPGNDTCCYFVPMCGKTAITGSAYKCMQSGTIFNSSAVMASPPNAANCCMTFVPTCQRMTVDGGWYSCPSTNGLTYDQINPTATTPSLTTCCQFVPTCGALDSSGTKATCNAGLELDPNAWSVRTISNDTCCRPSNCASTTSGFPPNIITYTNANGQYCWVDTCGHLAQWNDDGTVNTSLPAVQFPCAATYPGYLLNTTSAALASNQTSLSVCCYTPTCGQKDLTGNSYGCNSTLGQVLIPTNLNQVLTGDDIVDNPMCCWVPTCGVYSYMLQTPYQCPPQWVYSGNDSTINPSTSTCCIELFPDLTTTLTTVSSAFIGTQFDQTVTVTNGGDYEATGVTITQTLPNQVAFVSSSPADCTASGQTVTCSPTASVPISGHLGYTITVKASAAGIYSLTASAAASREALISNNGALAASVTISQTCQHYNSSTSAAYPCPVTYQLTTAAANLSSTSPDQATCCIELFPDLTTTLTTVSSAFIGTQFDQTVTVTNGGDYEATGVTITQTLPNQVAFVSSSPADCTASGQTVTCSPTASVPISGHLGYTITVKASAAGIYSLTASMAASREANAGNNGVLGASVTISQTCQHYNSSTSAAYPCPDTYKLTTTAANLSSTSPDQATCCTEKYPDLAITQTSSLSANNNQVYKGNTFAVTVTVSNQGEYGATNIAVTQTLPTGLNFVSSNPAGILCTPSGQTVTCTIPSLAPNGGSTPYIISVEAAAAGTYTVSSSVAPAPREQAASLSNNGPVQNSVTVISTCEHYTQGNQYPCTAPTFVANPANAASNNPDQATCCTELKPDLAITQSTTASSQVHLGEVFTTTLVVTNQGTYEATAVTTTQTLPARLQYVPNSASAGCAISDTQHLVCGPDSSIAVQATRTYSASVQAVTAGPVTLTASTATTRDSDPSNNGAVSPSITVTRTCLYSDATGSQYPCPLTYAFNTTMQDSTTVDQPTCCYQLYSNLVISQASTPANGQVTIGDTFTVTISIVNQGQYQATSVATTQTLPAGLQYVAPAPSGCAINNAQSLTCGPISSMPADNATVKSYMVSIKATATGTFGVTASVSATDINTSNNGPVTVAIVVGQTCQHYQSDGSPLVCSAGYTYQSSADNAANPSNSVCCQYVPICSAITASGAAYSCPAHYTLDPSKASSTSPNAPTCCMYVPTCDALWANGTAYQCPVGTQPNVTNSASTTTNDATCCQDIDACAGTDPCTSISHATPGTCTDLPAPDPGTGFTCNCASGYRWDPTTQPGSCSWIPQCGSVTDTGTPYTCPIGTQLITANSASTTTNDATCCEDIDACAGTDPCASVPHAMPGTCVDLPAPDPGTGFICNCASGYTWDSTTTPAGCSWIPKCGAVTDGGPPYACPTHYVNNPAAASQTTLSTASCCTFVPTCGFYAEDGSQYPCPVGLIFNSGNASSTTTNNATCCRKPPQGQCPVTDVRPTLYAPAGSSTDSIPVLVTFPVVDSQAAYCPTGATSGGQQANMCRIRLTSRPMFSHPGLTLTGVTSTAPPDGDGSDTQITYSCIRVTDLTCQIQLEVPHDGRWGVSLLPSSAQMDCNDQTFTLQPATTEIVADSKPPLLVNLTLTTAPTVATPDYQICTTFSEPVMWVTGSTSSTSSSSSSTTSSSMPTSTAAPAAFSSSSILLTNTMLLNITMASDALALLPDGTSSGAANECCMWLRTWAGATVQLAVLGAAYQDVAGNKGQQNVTLQVIAPGTDLWHQASNLASTATAVSAASSALSAAAAATSAAGAGGATSILRSIGHTQFLAMSVSLAVPWLPPEYVKLCTGLEWSNLVKPAEAVVEVTTNATTYLEGQRTPAPAPTGRRLTEAPTGPSGSDKQRHKQQQQQRAGESGRQLLSARDVSTSAPGSSSSSSSSNPGGQYGQLLDQQESSVRDWLSQHKAIGVYQSSNRSSTTSTSGTSSSGVFVFASNGSSSTNMSSLLATGITRQPKYFSLHDLQLSLLTLGVAVIAATLVQWLAAGSWRLLQLNPKNIPTLLVFPKPQVFIHTLLMIPVIYGAGKLLAISDLNTSDGAAGLACVVLLPLPVFAFWIYILYNWRKSLDASEQAGMARSKSSIMRTYSSPSLEEPLATERYEKAAATAAAAASREQQQGPSATLALLGTGEDNPTLIIRERRTGEEDFNQIVDPASSDEEDDRPAGFTRQPAASQNPITSGSGGTPGSSRPWRSLQSQGGGSSRTDGDPKSGRGLRAGAAAAPSVDELDASGNPSRHSRRSRPLAEAHEDSTLDEQQQRALAAAWNAARTAGPGSSTGGWASHPGGADAERMLSSGGVAVGGEGLSADGRRIVARQQTWMGAAHKDAEVAATAAGAGSFLDRYWYLVDDLVGDDRAAAVERVKLPVLTFFLVSAVQRCLTAVFFGLFHYSYVSVAQLGVLIAVHALFVVYLLTAKPYAFSILLYADVLAYCCELTILGAAVYLKQSPANSQLLSVLVTCYFVDVAVMLIPEVLRYAVMVYAWLRHRQLQQQGVPATAASDLTSLDGGVVAAVAVPGAPTGAKHYQHHQQQQHGKGHRSQPPPLQQQQRHDPPPAAAGPRTSDARSAANAAAAANAALDLTQRSKKQ